MNLDGRKIVVTGAFGSVGIEVTHALIEAGALVASVDYASATTSHVEAAGRVVLAEVDLCDPAEAAKAIESAAARLGGIDGLVNVAGGFSWEKVDGGDIGTWDRMYRLNLCTAVNASRAVLSRLPGDGRIVNIGAAGAIKAGAGMGAYAASKAGVAKLTEALAEELKDRRITVNAILPSIIDTLANRADMPNADFERWVKPEQIADLIVFLLSNRASAITGALIPITGRV